MVFTALTIAGSDPSGGAGIQADLKTFHQFGVYGASAITLLTVQNTTGVFRVQEMPRDLVGAQIDAVLSDLAIGACKTGALGTAAIIEEVAARLSSTPIPRVVDPVMISKHGAPLMDASAKDIFSRHLLPGARLLTPNAPEAEALSNRTVRTVQEARDAARAIADFGAQAVLVKGGHLDGDAVDILYDSGEILEFVSPRIVTPHTHGTGCTLSAAITALLSRGYPLRDAVQEAKRWLTEAIRTHPAIGQGIGPVNHFATTSVPS